MSSLSEPGSHAASVGRRRPSLRRHRLGPLGSLIAKRLIALPFLLLGVCLLLFVIRATIPGDPAVIFAGGERAQPEVVAQLREDWGLDEPLYVQYGTYVVAVVQGDLGWSFSRRTDVTEVLRQRLPATLELSIAALLLGVPVGLGLGVLSARRRGTPADHGARLLAIAGVSLPLFWIALMLAYVFSVELGWLPIGGRTDAFSGFDSITGFYTLDALLQGDLSAFGSAMRHLALPAIALAIVPAALMARFARSSFLEVLGENYIRTARAYGIPPRTILWRLAAKNAMLPLVTVLSLVVPALVIGSVFVEQVFSWPGIGTLLFEGLDARDFAVVQGTTLVVAALVIGMNLAADVSYALLDPRSRRP